ncbi:MAG: hypothetical protein ACON4Z_08400 [Planctomycetota bacterium]
MAQALRGFGFVLLGAGLATVVFIPIGASREAGEPQIKQASPQVKQASPEGDKPYRPLWMPKEGSSYKLTLITGETLAGKVTYSRLDAVFLDVDWAASSREIDLSGEQGSGSIIVGVNPAHIVDVRYYTRKN